MTYNVFSGTLNPTQSINQSLTIIPASIACCMSSSTNDCMLLASDLFNISVICECRWRCYAELVDWLVSDVYGTVTVDVVGEATRSIGLHAG